MSNNRLPMGRPSFTHRNRGVVGADAITLLSGVNFSSVEKVLAAIELIHKNSGTDLQALLKLSDVPLERVNPTDPRYKYRAEATLAFCLAVAVSPTADKYAQILHLDGRFLGATDV